MGVEGVGSLEGEVELFALVLPPLPPLFPPERVRSLEEVCVCVCVCVCV